MCIFLNRIIVLVGFQWVGFYIIFQACAFFLPRYLWRYCWEEGRMKALVSNLQTPIHTDMESVKIRQRLIVDYLYSNVGAHQCYAMKFFMCEFLNFINVTIQILLTDAFLGYEFSTYGNEVFTVWRISEVINSFIYYSTTCITLLHLYTCIFIAAL